ncbi:uncharacterized protein LOC106178446 [Lingula anatina]|uniref:Uncharacterized protein LOC106178446 n=1 Tax=Lingula anatina TaxID=7574 RepID=A0A1S3K4A8_LINAN|nr:uncharacterized protein LOC106178446 [Lingula anatina]|eukprot:XP_013417086.1 uncharacterized protein LOC106178446 [Lingula anatina]
MNLMSLLAAFLFSLEAYHFIGHVLILFRMRLLPRKDLVRQRYYFLVDAMTVFTTNFLFTGKLQWLAVIQNIQHGYYFLTWDSSSLCKKVISWSSLDWQRSHHKKRWELLEVFGTTFDVLVHTINCYLLGQYLTTVEVIISLFITHCLVYVILHNPLYAWSNPVSTPDWVEKRIFPIGENYEGCVLSGGDAKKEK